MDYKRSYRLSRAGLIGGAIVAFIGCGLSMKIGLLGAVLGYIGLAAMAFALVQAFIFYKCPKCGRHFNLRGQRPAHCPFCGYELEK